MKIINQSKRNRTPLASMHIPQRFRVDTIFGRGGVQRYPHHDYPVRKPRYFATAECALNYASGLLSEFVTYRVFDRVARRNVSAARSA